MIIIEKPKLIYQVNLEENNNIPHLFTFIYQLPTDTDMVKMGREKNQVSFSNCEI